MLMKQFTLTYIKDHLDILQRLYLVVDDLQERVKVLSLQRRCRVLDCEDGGR